MKKGQQQEQQGQEQQEQTQEQIREQVQARLQELQQEASSKASSSSSSLTPEDQAIASALQKGKVLSFKGKGSQGFYHIAYRGKAISKVTRTEGNTFQGEFTKQEGTRQEVAIAEIKFLRGVGIEVKV